MNIIDRVKNILITPNREWPAIHSETPDVGRIVTTYILPLVGLGAAAIFIGYGLIGYSYYGVNVGSFRFGLTTAILYAVMTVARVFIVALVIDLLAPTFESEKNFNRSFQLSAYTFTASYIGALFFLIPALSFLSALCSLYCIYTLYTGIPVMKKTLTDKQIAYTAVIILVSILAMVVIGMINAGVMRLIYGYGYGFRFI